MAIDKGGAFTGTRIGGAIGAGLGGLAGTFIAPGAGTGAGAAIGAGLGGTVGGYLGGVSGPTAGRSQSTLAGTQRQQQGLEQQLGTARTDTLGAFDEARQAKLDQQKLAIEMMRSALGVPGAAVLAASGVAGLIGSGAAGATSRQAAVTAQTEADRIQTEIANRLAELGIGRATKVEQDVQADITAASDRAQKAQDDATALTGQYTVGSSAVSALRNKRDTFPPGSPEWEAYNNEANRVAEHFLT